MIVSDWIVCQHDPPPNGQVVETKIDDEKGARNETKLVRQNRLWFFPDFSMYVYYEPTHWRPVEK